VNLDDQEEDDSGGALASIYRLPPFWEAPRSNQNQVGSPPPLPIPLRIPYPHDYFGDLGPNNAVDVGWSGQVRSPPFTRYVLCCVSDPAAPIFHPATAVSSIGGFL
jgi:hypothetical protein